MMNTLLKGQVALVTGASSGFGAGIAGQLAKKRGKNFTIDAFNGKR